MKTLKKDFFKKNKILIVLGLIVLMGSFLRLYRFGDLARFNADQVRDTLVVEKIIKGEDFPLLGPKAGGTTFKLGPIFYYFQAFSGLIFGNTPFGTALFVGILSVISIVLFFNFSRYYFSLHISLILAFVYACSFYMIKYSRFAWNPNGIPFFLILFLLSILKFVNSEKRKIDLWTVFLAVSLGVGAQLHTLLLVLMPAILIFAHSYTFFKERKFYFSRFLFVSLFALILNLPFFVYDWQNEGENLKSFLAGAEKKTEKNASLSANFLKNTQFFIQGNFYTLSSFEMQKNWIRPRKFFRSNLNFSEGAAMFLGTIFLFWGFFHSIKKLIRIKNDEKKKTFLGLILAVAAFSFLIFLPIANELNVRYFIVLFFLPFVFLGFLVEILEKKLSRKMFLSVVSILLIFLTFQNLRTWAKTYDLENYSGGENIFGEIDSKESKDGFNAGENTDKYGGISLFEASGISDFMFKSLKKEKGLDKKTAFFSSFKFKRSVEYFNEKKGLKLSELPKEKEQLNPETIVFFVFDKRNSSENIEKSKEKFEIVDSLAIGRFEVFMLKKKK